MRIIDLSAPMADGWLGNWMAFFHVTEPVLIDSIQFGSTIAINGPECDWFAVTDQCVTLSFSAPGYYRLEVSGHKTAVFCCALNVA